MGSVSMVDAKLSALGLGGVLSFIGGAYLVLLLALLLLAGWLMWKRRFGWAALPVIPLVWLGMPLAKEYATHRAYMAKYEPAKAIFDKLCAEQSQPIIKRVVEDVEGVLLINVPPSVTARFAQCAADPMCPSAAILGNRTASSGYAEFFLLDRGWQKRGAPNSGKQWKIFSEIGTREQRGFRFVDVLQADGKSRTRITAIPDPTVKDSPATGIRFKYAENTTDPAPRFAVSMELNVDPNLRKHWIAGATIKVIDTVTNEVVAEQSHWRWDSGFGSLAGFRQPWTAARHVCPNFPYSTGVDHLIVDTLIKAKQGERR
jgi:hypothetical protein